MTELVAAVEGLRDGKRPVVEATAAGGLLGWCWLDALIKRSRAWDRLFPLVGAPAGAAAPAAARLRGGGAGWLQRHSNDPLPRCAAPPPRRPAAPPPRRPDYRPLQPALTALWGWVEVVGEKTRWGRGGGGAGNLAALVVRGVQCREVGRGLPCCSCAIQAARTERMRTGPQA
jgi:hypothetical protein